MGSGGGIGSGGFNISLDESEFDNIQIDDQADQMEEQADGMDEESEERRRRMASRGRGRAANILGGQTATSGFSLSRETLLGN